MIFGEAELVFDPLKGLFISENNSTNWPNDPVLHFFEVLLARFYSTFNICLAFVKLFKPFPYLLNLSSYWAF